MPKAKFPRVAIIMSTYNGDKYLVPQLNSLLEQTYPYIDIYIRDDGSTDGTLKILRRYAKQHPQIHLETGKNLGFAASFLKVLAGAEGYDYYAFCDQDDVWFDFKIERAVDCLSDYSQDQPLLYASSYDYYDAGLTFREHAKTLKHPDSFMISLTQCITIGTCMVVNNRTRELLLRVSPEQIFAHDCLTATLCAALGQVFYDPTPTMKYRRTGDNVSPTGMHFVQLQFYRIKNFLIDSKLQEINRQNRHIAEVFYPELSPSNQEVISLFMGQNTLSKCLRKTFHPRRWRRNLFDELALRCLFLFGKL